MRAFPGNDERMSVLHQDSGGIGKSIPSALEISLGHGFCTPRPSGCKTHGRGKSLKISLDPREILGVGDGFSNPSLLLVERGYNAARIIALIRTNTSAFSKS